MTTDYPLIPPERAHEWIGKAVHVTWAKRGCVWRLLEIKGDYVALETIKTKRRMGAKLSDIYATNNQVNYKKML